MSHTKRILLLEPGDYSHEAYSILTSFAQVDNGPLTRQELLQAIHRYDYLIVRLAYRIDSEVIEAATHLKAIVTATTGLNHIDVESASKHNIAVLSLQGEYEFLDSVYATAEHTWALILSLIRHLPHAYSDVCNGQWNRDRFKGFELHGKTLGIIGLGRLGKKVARYGLAFGMKVLAYDIDHAKQADNGIEMVDLDTLLTKSDVVSLHVNYNSETHALIGNDEFAKMKNHSVFINTSRGEIVDEEALLFVLQKGQIAGAALDVLCGENAGDEEWMRKDPLIAYAQDHNNLIITPHIGGATYDSMDKTEIFMAKKLYEFVKAQSHGMESS